MPSHSFFKAFERFTLCLSFLVLTWVSSWVASGNPNTFDRVVNLMGELRKDRQAAEVIEAALRNLDLESDSDLARKIRFCERSEFHSVTPGTVGEAPTRYHAGSTVLSPTLSKTSALKKLRRQAPPGARMVHSWHEANTLSVVFAMPEQICLDSEGEEAQNRRRLLHELSHVAYPEATFRPETFLKDYPSMEAFVIQTFLSPGGEFRAYKTHWGYTIRDQGQDAIPPPVRDFFDSTGRLLDPQGLQSFLLETWGVRQQLEQAYFKFLIGAHNALADRTKQVAHTVNTIARTCSRHRVKCAPELLARHKLLLKHYGSLRRTLKDFRLAL